MNRNKLTKHLPKKMIENKDIVDSVKKKQQKTIMIKKI